MSRFRLLVPAVAFLSITGFTRPAAAQVNELQIAPVNITMAVGETRTFLATAYDTRGNPLITSNIRWLSTDENVVTVSFDPATPNVVTVTAVQPGVASIEARSGTIVSRSVISVGGPGGPAEVTQQPGDLPDNVLAAMSGHLVRIDAEIFGITPTCRMGGFVEPDLVATSYTAIRGATELRATLADGRTIDDVSIAAYDLDSDIALLRVNANHSGQLNRGGDPSSNQQVWMIAQPNCSSTGGEAIQITGTGDSRLTLGRDLGESYRGAPLISNSGSLVGMAASGSSGVPASQLGRFIAVARGNVTSGQLQNPEAVARRENHAYGSLSLQSQTFGASARVTPLEDWHWPETARDGRLPFTFTGPMGRYTVALVSGGNVLSTVTAEVRPGTTTRMVLAPPVADEPEEQRAGGGQIGQPRGGGGFPMPLAIAGGVGAAGALALLLLSGGDDGPTPIPQPTTGGIRIRIPVP